MLKIIKKEDSPSGGKGRMMIDYVLEDEEIRERLNRIKVGEKMNLSHQPMKRYI